MSNGNGHSWSKFSWRDWSADKALHPCSLAARGFWIEMLCIMHEGCPVGHLTMGGKPATIRQMAANAFCSEKEATKHLAELEAAGVFSRTTDGTIYSRRMVKDALKSEIGAVEVRKKWGEGEQSGLSRTSRLTEARRKGTHSQEEWLAMLEAIGNRCLRCGSPAAEARGGVVKDHIKPIYQGGSDAIDNLQPLCASCNSSKGPDNTDLRPSDWKERLGKCLGHTQEMPRSMPRETPTKNLESEKEREDSFFLKEKDSVSPPAREAEPSEAAVRAARRQSAADVSAMPAPAAMAIRSAAASLRNYSLDGQRARQTINEQREDVATRTPIKPAYLSREQLQAARRQQLRVVA